MKLPPSLLGWLMLLFGVSSWIGINSIWLQLPLMLPQLPEGWNLTSYLAVLVQLGNIGPLLISLFKWWNSKLLEKYVGYLVAFILISSIASVLGLGFLWHGTIEIFGAYRSVPLFIFAFLIATCDCTSNVAYLPFVSRFEGKHLTWFFVGIGFGGLLGAVLSMVQGTGSYICANTTNQTLEAIMLPPRFSPTVFYCAIAGLLFLASLAFLALNFLDTEPLKSVASVATIRTEISDNGSKSEEKIEEVKEEKQRSKHGLFPILILIVWICALMNTVLPSIQTYTALPYGIQAFHWSVIASAAANPLGCFLAFIWKPSNLCTFTGLTAIGTATSGYLLFLAVLSPYPPLMDGVWGQIIMVAAWAVTFFWFAFLRTVMAEHLRNLGAFNYLFYSGVATQLGSFLAAFVTFPLVNFTDVFRAAEFC